MGNGYNRQLHHQNLNHQRSSTNFLPMLCSRPSIKDVQLPKWKNGRSASFSDDPSSPKVSCMGQVKRSNRVIAFPTSYRITTTNAATTTKHSAAVATTIKYHKLKRLFSGKNLSTTTITPSRGPEMIADRARRPKLGDDCDNCGLTVNVAELDPPLPVVKREQQPPDVREEVNLWKRRFGGAPLKGLQLQQINIPSKHCIQPTTV